MFSMAKQRNCRNVSSADWRAGMVANVLLEQVKTFRRVGCVRFPRLRAGNPARGFHPRDYMLWRDGRNSLRVRGCTIVHWAVRRALTPRYTIKRRKNRGRKML